MSPFALFAFLSFLATVAFSCGRHLWRKALGAHSSVAIMAYGMGSWACYWTAMFIALPAVVLAWQEIIRFFSLHALSLY